VNLILNMRLIDRQSTKQSILEVYAGPDDRRVRFFANSIEAYSQVWSGVAWQEVHHLISTGALAPEEAISTLFPVTGDILGWDHA
jgi:hypothetical protein